MPRAARVNDATTRGHCHALPEMNILSIAETPKINWKGELLLMEYLRLVFSLGDGDHKGVH